MTRRSIVITADDHEQLQTLLDSNVSRLVSGCDRLDELQTELNRALVVEENEIPADVVTMKSTVILRDLDTNESETYTLVYPDRADIANHKLSVLAPIGTAILGYHVGDDICWRVPEGRRRLRVEQVLFASERDGTFHL